MPSLPLFNAMLKVCARAADLDRAKSGTTHSVCVCVFLLYAIFFSFFGPFGRELEYHVFVPQIAESYRAI